MTRPIRPLVVDDRNGISNVTGVDISNLTNYTEVDPPHSVYGLREMNSSEIDALHIWIRYLYARSPSVTLSYVGSGGNVSTMNDTRLQAGAYRTRVDRFPTEGETPEPSTVTVSYSRIQQTVVSGLTQRAGFPRPLYMDYTSFSRPVIRTMSMNQVITNIIAPAMNKIHASQNYMGGYTIWNNTASAYQGTNTVEGGSFTDIGTVYTDTRANTGLYSAGGIPETLDQPTTITEYKLLYGQPVSQPRPEMMIYRDGTDGVRRYSWPDLRDYLQNLSRWWAADKLTYNINGAGTTQGAEMSDTKLNGSGNYQTRYVNTDDYRAQEFPDGTSVVQNTYRLRANIT